MKLLKSATGLLDNPAELRKRFDLDGYLYLQGVMDVEVIESVRTEMEELLITHGFGERVKSGVQYTGKTAGRASIRSPQELEAEYNRRGLATRIQEHPPHRRLFEAVAAEEVDFLPITEYRTRPPGNEPLTWHQDGYYNTGLELCTAWIPMVEMTEEMGGLAVAEGFHRRGYVHASYPPPRAESLPSR